MAFNYYTIDSIKQIEIANIPHSFILYYQNLSEEMQNEIKDVRPDIIQAISRQESSDVELDEGPKMDTLLIAKTDSPEAESVVDAVIDGNEVGDKEDESEDVGESVDNEEYDEEIEDEEEYSPVLEAWGDISIRAWQKKEIETSVVVCKIIPDKTERCPIHRIPLLEKQLKIKKKNGGTYSIMGFLCPECMDFFIRQDGVGNLIQKLDEYRIQAWIQTLEDTLAEWKENTLPLDFGDDIPIYVPDTWVDGQTTCPIHPEQPLIEDTYRKSYKDRSVEFRAYYCEACQKHIMRNALAQKLEDDCSEIGLPPIEFRPLRPEPKPKVSAVELAIKPDYFISDGKRTGFDFDVDDEDSLWNQVTESDTVVINYSRSCVEVDHEAEDTLALIKVQEKKEGDKYYVVLVGYCEECEKYYIAEEDFALLAEKGRPALTLIDETGKYNSITSGTTFDHERDHLNDLEDTLDKKIDDIQHSPGYVSKYAVGDFDDGSLLYAKAACEPLYKEIKRLADLKPKPYGYRTDITLGDKTEIYYLGINDIKLDGNSHVISFNSDLGRKMVNYRTLDLMMGGAKWKVKRRRTFDIDKEILYGFTEQSDEDVIFRSGITDTFLINVLNMRKKQHQLIDIISTIQEKQNDIVDVPITKNLIVQGCAGSGKTMVLLHRLSALKYNNPSFDFDNALILTPNGNFNTHIAGLASSLQLGYIDRYSVEDYYYFLLQKYDSSFKLRNPISDEMNVNQVYVDYMYSDEFRALMEQAYRRRISEIRELFSTLSEISVAVHREPVSAENLGDKDLVGHLRLEIETLAGKIKLQDEEFVKAWEKRNDSITQQGELKQRLSDESTKIINISLAESAKVSKILTGILQKKLEKIKELGDSISRKEAEYKKVEETILVYRKAVKLNQIQEEIHSLENEQLSMVKEIDNLKDLINTNVTGMDINGLLAFFDDAAVYSPDIRTSKETIQKQQDVIADCRKQLEEYSEQIQDLRNQADSVAEARIPKDLQERIQSLSEQTRELSPKHIYQDIYSIASAKADDILFSRTGKRYIKNVRGTHRYDLYLQLIFALHFFNKKTGENTFICIDEGQDLTPGEYRLIREVNSRNPVFNVYGDTNQLLKYRRGITDWSQVEEIIPFPQKFSLNENYRNTNQITQYCNDTFDMNVSLTGVDGHSVKEIARVKLESTLAKIKNSEERIAVILPRSVKKEDYIDKDQLPPAVKEMMGDTVDNGKIAVVYVDEVKGVEFDRIFVVPNSMSKNERYIAFTRALTELTVVYDESLNPVVQLPAQEPDQSTEHSEKEKNPKSPAFSSSNITIGKVKVKRDKEAEEKREALRQKIGIGSFDIVKYKGKAIVTSYSADGQNGKLDAAIRKAAGKDYVQTIEEMPACEVGEVFLTKGYQLDTHYIIHANSPKWNADDEKMSEELLIRTYKNIMQCALENGIRIIAIPSLSTGYKGFPKGKASYIALSTVGEFIKEHQDKIDRVNFSILDKDIKEIYDRLFRHFGKREDTRVSVGNCKKCKKRIRIRKRRYDKFVVEGYIPSYCNTCGGEPCEKNKCEKCGELFDITYRDRDYSKKTGCPLPAICPACIKKEKTIETGASEVPGKTNDIQAVQDNSASEKAIVDTAAVSSTSADGSVLQTETIQSKEKTVADVSISGDLPVGKTGEKRYLNYAKIRDFLPDEIIDSKVTEVSETIKTILASSHVKSNKALIQLLMDEDVFDDEQLAEIEEYMKKLILSMFYV